MRGKLKREWVRFEGGAIWHALSDGLSDTYCHNGAVSSLVAVQYVSGTPKNACTRCMTQLPDRALDRREERFLSALARGISANAAGRHAGYAGPCPGYNVLQQSRIRREIRRREITVVAGIGGRPSRKTKLGQTKPKGPKST